MKTRGDGRHDELAVRLDCRSVPADVVGPGYSDHCFNLSADIPSPHFWAGKYTVIRAGLHIPHRRRIRLRNLSRRLGVRDAQLRGIEILHLLSLLDFLGGLETVVEEMACCLYDMAVAVAINSVGAHGGDWR